MTIKKFLIEYDAVNSKNTFTNGDTINGRIIVEVSKKTKIQSLIFTAKGKAWIYWTEDDGQRVRRNYAEEKYYEVQHDIIRQAAYGDVGKGRHVFPFSFNIPDREMPSSFKSNTGDIAHTLKAELKQSMNTKKTKTLFTYVSKADMNIPGLMEPQYGYKDKSIFGSGNISMDVQTRRMGYRQGEALKIKVEVSNCSNRSVKPKFVLYEKRSYFAPYDTSIQTKKILKDKAEAVSSSRQKTVNKVITIPMDLRPSIMNCSIIKLEYMLKIYLDVSFAANPKIELPIVVLPFSEVSAMTQPPPHAGFGFGSPDQAAWSTTPQLQAAPQAVDPPPPYGAYAMYPNMDGFVVENSWMGILPSDTTVISGMQWVQRDSHQQRLLHY